MIDPLVVLIGSSRKMRALLQRVALIAAVNTPVTLIGETGTGKNALARLIHQLSRRKGEFVEVSAPRLRSGLAESVLYGHTKYAFTGALQAFKGRWAQAHDGSFFLNELHRLRRKGQDLLLQLLDGGPVSAISSTVDVRHDVRLMVGSPVAPGELAKAGRLDEHLLYRLGSLPLWIPPLRERMEDLDELVQHCIERCALERKVPRREWSADAMALLREFDWPGNVRQLFNVVEASSVFARGAAVTRDCVSEVLAGVAACIVKPATGAEDIVASTARLVQLCGSHAEAARALGCVPKTVSRRMQIWRTRSAAAENSPPALPQTELELVALAPRLTGPAIHQ